MGPQPALIEARNLIKTYAMGDQTVHALRGVSLDIGEGRNLGVMQPLLFSAGIWMDVGKALDCQETVGGDEQGGMVMEAAPTVTFVMRHAELLL